MVTLLAFVHKINIDFCNSSYGVGMNGQSKMVHFNLYFKSIMIWVRNWNEKPSHFSTSIFFYLKLFYVPKNLQ